MKRPRLQSNAQRNPNGLSRISCCKTDVTFVGHRRLSEVTSFSIEARHATSTPGAQSDQQAKNSRRDISGDS